MRDATGDGRSAVRLQHRAALLDAAARLIEERGGPRFGVDELAAAAGVARRTVFNHFGSLHGVLQALAERVLTDRVDELLARTPAGPEGGAGASVFRFVGRALSSMDLAGAVVEVERVLRGLDEARASLLVEQSFTRVSDALVHEVLLRDADADALETELTVRALVAGVQVVARHWHALPGDRGSAAARQQWDDLLESGIRHLAAGAAVT